MDDRPGSGARNDARNETVVFAPTSVRTRGRPPFLAVGLAAGLVTLVALGALGGHRGGSQTALAPEDTRASSPAVAIATTTTSRRPLMPPKPPPVAARPTARPAFVSITLRPAGSHLFVHGDVFSLAVISVRVSVEDAAGHVAKRQTIALEADGTSARTGSVDRFDVHFDIPDEVMGEGLWVVADAYDGGGTPLATQRLAIVIPAGHQIDVAPGPATLVEAAIPPGGAPGASGLGDDLASGR